MEKRRARRKIPHIYKKRYRITVNLMDYQYELVTTIARQDGISLSEVMVGFLYLPSDLPIGLMIQSLRDKHYGKCNPEQ